MKKLLLVLAAVLTVAACVPESSENQENKQENQAGPQDPQDPQNPQDPPATEPKYDAPELVDLGLPSGVKWAASDLGSADPMVPGDYFSWGDTDAAVYFGSSNKYWEYEGGNGYATKYSVSMRQGRLVDMKTVLEPEDDAATVGIGKGWRTPTYDDFMELMDNCSWQNGEETIVLTSLKNGNSITFLNRGHYEGSRFEPSSVYMSASLACYDLRASANNGVYVLFGGDFRASGYRTLGMNVRPVCGGEAKGYEWKVNATEPEISGTSASIGGVFHFDEEVLREYKYYVKIFDGIAGDTPLARKEFARGAKATFSGLEAGHTYYYIVCYEAKWREGSYTYTEDGNSEVRSFTMGN